MLTCGSPWPVQRQLDYLVGGEVHPASTKIASADERQTVLAASMMVRQWSNGQQILELSDDQSSSCPAKRSSLNAVCFIEIWVW